MQFYGISNNLLKAFNAITLVIFGVAVENWLYPLLEKRRASFHDMARITLGLFFMAVSKAHGTMMQASSTAHLHAKVSRGSTTRGPDSKPVSDPSELSIFLQLPLSVLVTISEVFAFVTGQAYEYKQALRTMKSLLQSIHAVFNRPGHLLTTSQRLGIRAW